MSDEKDALSNVTSEPYFREVDGYPSILNDLFQSKKRVNRFEYVSWSKREFDLPTRASKESAGYDFHSPVDGCIEPGAVIEFSLEVKVQVKPGEFLFIPPRSSLGFKGDNHVALTNTVGVIDSDYYNNFENEGEIRLKLKNFGDKPFYFKKNDRLVQGIFLYFDVTEDDEVETLRHGGLGSTGN